MHIDVSYFLWQLLEKECNNVFLLPTIRILKISYGFYKFLGD